MAYDALHGQPRCERNFEVVVGAEHHHARSILLDLVDELDDVDLLSVIHPTAYVGASVSLGRVVPT